LVLEQLSSQGFSLARLQAFDLNGTNAYVLVPNNPIAGFNFDGSFSIDAWIYLKSSPAEFAPIVSKWNDIGVHQRSYFMAVQKYNGLANLLGR
jgi:hypothetical protein